MEQLNVHDAPDAIGPYCHAMKVGNLLFCSGQTPLDPDTMKIPESLTFTSINLWLEISGI